MASSIVRQLFSSTPDQLSTESSPQTPLLPAFHATTAPLPALGARRNPRYNLRAFAISPHNVYYSGWQLLLALLVISSAAVPPAEMVLDNEGWSLLSVADNICNILFGIDIILTFFVAYVDEYTHRIVDDHRKIATKYAISWLALDVLSSIPMKAIRNVSPMILNEYGLFSLIRLCRLKRILDMFNKWENDITLNYNWLRCAKFASVSIYVINRAACLFYVLAAYNDDPTNTWIGQAMPQGVDFRKLGLWCRYILCMYWSTTTFSTAGYGDLHPVNSKERAACTIYMLLIFAASSYVIGNISQLMIDVTMKRKSYRELVQAATGFALRNRLPSHLEDQMISHLTLNYRTNLEGLQEKMILDSLPNAIRTSISHHLFHSVIDKVYLFRTVSEGVLFELVREIKVEYFPPNKDVILKNDTPTDFYIIVSGAVDLLGEDQVVGEARKGEVVGEIGVLCFKPQLFTVRTKRLTQLLRLDRTTFLNIVKGHAEDGANIMKNFTEHLNDPGMKQLVEGMGMSIDNLNSAGKGQLTAASQTRDKTPSRDDAFLSSRVSETGKASSSSAVVAP
ncbi:hypothetical protein SASPL_112861 [Salvia splendens]|uniref:Potassium channel n=1 Tax=Salvia splendens TaxID=180675 RepID=A0A8X9A4Z6_SALSN|nr:hypothetical protein SASPL_112861 [Salvia splendens]